MMCHHQILDSSQSHQCKRNGRVGKYSNHSDRLLQLHNGYRRTTKRSLKDVSKATQTFQLYRRLSSPVQRAFSPLRHIRDPTPPMTQREETTTRSSRRSPHAGFCSLPQGRTASSSPLSQSCPLPMSVLTVMKAIQHRTTAAKTRRRLLTSTLLIQNSLNPGATRARLRRLSRRRPRLSGAFLRRQ